jgi:hypothetical protein
MRTAGCQTIRRCLHPREQAPSSDYFFAFFLAADFLALTGDFLAAFFFAALGMCLHLSVLCRAMQLCAAARLGLRTIIEEFLRLAIMPPRLLARGREFFAPPSAARRDPTRAA